VSKRLKSTLLSYWKSQNLSSKIFKICPQASLGHSAGKSNFRSLVKCRLRTFRTGLYMQGADTQTFRRLSISTVRKSLKVKKNFQNQAKSNLVCNPEGVSGYPEDSEVYKSEEKGNKSKWPQKVQETKKTKG
jgi:hypothetical protein